MRWECSYGGLFVPYPTGAVECLDQDPTDGRTPTLTPRAFFPSCWDGTPPSDADATPGRTSYDDTPTTSYPKYVAGTGWTCPATHP